MYLLADRPKLSLLHYKLLSHILFVYNVCICVYQIYDCTGLLVQLQIKIKMVRNDRFGLFQIKQSVHPMSEKIKYNTQQDKHNLR